MLQQRSANEIKIRFGFNLGHNFASLVKKEQMLCVEKGWEACGRALIDTRDLDPVYCVLYDARRSNVIDDAQIYRWLLAYWCFYHCGAASFIASAKSEEEFWERMLRAARNDDPTRRWPRAPERRYFRGDKCVCCVDWLKQQYGSAEMAIKSLTLLPESAGGATIPFAVIRARVMCWPLFGPWIAWKVCDMLERVLGIPIDFAGAERYMYDQPKQCAVTVVASELGVKVAKSNEGNVLSCVVESMRQRLHNVMAPPNGLRAVQIQELETVLCKYKGCLNGTYSVGKDASELRHVLDDPQWGILASSLACFVPQSASYKNLESPRIRKTLGKRKI